MECTISFAVAIASVMCNRLCLNVRDMVRPYEVASMRLSKFSFPFLIHVTTLPSPSQSDGPTTATDESTTMELKDITDIGV